jgi:hypothetical protein
MSRRFASTFFALTIDFIVAARRKKIETLGIDVVDERLACAGQNHDAIARVLTDLMEEVDELFVRVAIEDQCATVRVEDDLEHAFRRAGEHRVRKFVMVGVEGSHRPLLSSDISLKLKWLCP